jgi:hypothetical protein
MKTTYLSAAETAKLIRAQLKKHFPGTKFSVRSDTYSMGASVDVTWTDGPAAPLVEAIAGQFSGSNFDGMIDMKTGHSSWLMPDGTACVASDPGTTGSAGSRSPERNWMPDPDAKLVHFGADYVHTHRRHSRALIERIVSRLAAKGLPVEAIKIVDQYDGAAGVQTVIYDRDVTRGFDMEREVYQAARRTHCTKAGQ